MGIAEGRPFPPVLPSASGFHERPAGMGECLHLGSPPLSISGDTDTFCNSDVMLMNLAMEGFRLLFNNNKEVLIQEVFFLFVFFFPRDLIRDNRGGVEAS